MRRAEVTLEIAALIARLPATTINDLAHMLAMRGGKCRLRRLLSSFFALADEDQEELLAVMLEAHPIRLVSDPAS